MFFVSLILFFITVLFVISLTVGYYRSRSFFKRREKLIRREIAPFRKTLPEETAGVRRYFGVSIPPDAEVYGIEGSLEWISLTNKNGVFYEFWIGGIQIQYRQGEMEPLFMDAGGTAVCEYTLLPGDRKKKAYPLRINEQVITDRFGREKGSFPDAPYRGCTFRDALPQESRALLRPRFQEMIYLSLPSLLCLTLAIYLSYEENAQAPFFLAAGIITGVLSLLPLFLPPRRREEGKQICTVSGNWERIENRGRQTRFCRLVGTDDKFRLPRQAAKQLPASGYCGQAELYLKGVRGKRNGRLVSLNGWSLDERVRPKLVKRPLQWILLGTLLFLSASIHFMAVAGGKSINVLTALPRNIAEGPLVIEKAEDTLDLKGGELVEFRNLTAIPDTPYSNRYLPLKDTDSLYDSLSKRQKQRIDVLLEDWQYMVDNLNRTVRYRNGALLFNGDRPLVSPENIRPCEEDLIETTDGEERFIVDIPPMVCIRHDSFFRFLNTPSPGGLIERVPYGLSLQKAVRSGVGLNPYVINIVLFYKSELAERAGTILSDYRDGSTDPSEKGSPYPLFCYSGLSHYLNNTPEREKPDFQGKDLLTTPIGEIIEQNILYGEKGIFTLNGTYYLDSRYDYSQAYLNGEDSSRRIGMSPYSYYLLFLRRIILTLVYLGAGLLILVSGLISRLRD